MFKKGQRIILLFVCITAIFLLRASRHDVHAVVFPTPTFDVGMTVTPASVTAQVGKSTHKIDFQITNNGSEPLDTGIDVWACDSEIFTVDLTEGKITEDGTLQDSYLSNSEGKGSFYWGELGWNTIPGGESFLGYFTMEINNNCTGNDCGTCPVTLYVRPSVQNADEYTASVVVKSAVVAEPELVTEPELEPEPVVEPQSEPVPAPTPEPEMEKFTFDDIQKEQLGVSIKFSRHYSDASLDNVNKFSIGSNEGHGFVMFSSGGDMSSGEMVQKLNSLDEYVIFGKGFVEIDTESFPALGNSPAVITLTGLNFDQTPKVLVNGKEDTEGLVSNINYDVEKGIVEFDVEHFTRFEVVADVEEGASEPVPVGGSELIDDSSSEKEYNFSREEERVIFSIVLIAVLFIIIPGVTALLILLRGKKTSRLDKATDEVVSLDEGSSIEE